MAPVDPQHDLEEQLRRSRACVAASKESIARCTERIRQSHRVVTQVMGKAKWAAAAVGDDHLQAAKDWGEAQQQQRLIDREVRQTCDQLPRPVPGEEF